MKTMVVVLARAQTAQQWCFIFLGRCSLRFQVSLNMVCPSMQGYIVFNFEFCLFCPFSLVFVP